MKKRKENTQNKKIIKKPATVNIVGYRSHFVSNSVCNVSSSCCSRICPKNDTSIKSRGHNGCPQHMFSISPIFFHCCKHTKTHKIKQNKTNKKKKTKTTSICNVCFCCFAALFCFVVFTKKKNETTTKTTKCVWEIVWEMLSSSFVFSLFCRCVFCCCCV